MARCWFAAEKYTFTMTRILLLLTHECFVTFDWDFNPRCNCVKTTYQFLKTYQCNQAHLWSQLNSARTSDCLLIHGIRLFPFKLSEWETISLMNNSLIFSLCNLNETKAVLICESHILFSVLTPVSSCSHAHRFYNNWRWR